MQENAFYKLTIVTHRQQCPEEEYLKFIEICAQSGITAVQLREKNMSYPELLEFGKKLKVILDPLQIPLIVNDNIQLALDLDAAGVHLGQNDEAPLRARKLLGDHKIIGISINSLEELHQANTLPINYVGCASIFKTESKKNVATFWGLAGLRECSLLSAHPVVAIGGINCENAQETIKAGAHGIAAIGVFHNAHSPQENTRILRTIIEKKGLL